MSRIDYWRGRLDDEMSRLAAECEVPEVSIAVLVDDQVIEATAGVVNLQTGVEVTAATRVPDPVDHQGVDSHPGPATRR
jgi:hypothetical protein